ncbi:MAG: hypothetical protein MI742_06605 [Desulfobacterales bacterium]|nr:hypothetical protein [Desulfobacterales bacterium]
MIARWITIIMLALIPIHSAFAMGRAPTEAFNLAPSDYQWTYQEKLLILNMQDGVTLSGNLFVPVAKTEKETFPALLFPNSWLMEEHEYRSQAEKFCEKGYIVLSYSARGWGKSEGMVNVGGPKDMSDIKVLVDWLTKNQPVQGVVRGPNGEVTNDSNALIGMCGISLGGGLSLMGAATDTRVKAVMAMVPWGDLADALYLNQSPKPVWHKGLLVGLGDMVANLDPYIETVTGWLFNHEHAEHYADIVPWAMQRSPISHLSAFNNPNRNLAVCISTNLQDFLFTPNQILRFYYGLNVAHKRIDFNRGIHPSAELPGLAGLPNTVWNRAYAWFDQHLKGVDTGILNNPPISIENKSDKKKRHYLEQLYIQDINGNHLEKTPSPPIENAIAAEKRFPTPRPWYSYKGGLKTSAPQEGSVTIHSGIASGLTLGIPILSSLLEAHTTFLHVKTSLPLTSRKKAIVFASERFEKRRTLLGTPALTLSLTPSNPRVQLMAHLYSVDKLGIGTLITHGPLTLLESDRLMPNATPGQRHTYQFNLITTAADIPKGHRLAIGIDTFDPSYAKASDDDFSVTLHYGPETFIEIPWL